MTDTKTTYKEYSSFVDFVLKTAIDEHKLLLVDLDNAQLGTLKQYLWLSALIIGAIASLIGYDQPQMASMNLPQAIYCAGLTIAASSATYAFIQSIRLMCDSNIQPITHHYNQPLWDAFGDDESYKVLTGKQLWVDQISNNIRDARKNFNRIGRQMRPINHAIVFSAVLGALSTGLFFLNFLFRIQP